jgi:hypothetical protein
VIFAGLGVVVVVVVVVLVVVVAVVPVVVDPVDVDPVVLLVLLLPVVVDPVVDVLTVCCTPSGPFPAMALAVSAPATSRAENRPPIASFRLTPPPFRAYLEGLAGPAGAQTRAVRFK